MLLANTAEGGTNGVAATPGNTGGASGDAFNTVTIGTAATLAPDSSTSAHGALSYSIATAGTSATAQLLWTSIGSLSTIFWRSYLRISAANTGQGVIRARAAGVQSFRVAVGSTGKLTIRDTANTTVATSSTTLSVNTWYRLEGFCTVGGSSTAELKIWSAIDSLAAPVETLTITAQNFGAGNIDEAGWGIFSAAANVSQYWLDDLAVTDVGYPGPAVVSVTDTGGAFRTLSPLDAVTGAVAVTDAAGVVHIMSPLDAIAAGVVVTDGAGFARLLSSRDLVTAGATVSDGAGILRGLRSLDTVVGGSGGGGFSGTDSAGMLRLLSAEDCWRAGTDVTRPISGLVTRPSTGLVGRPDSGLVCRP